MEFEELDRIIGGHAPFLMSLSDGSREELRLVIAAAEVGELGANIPEFSDIDEAAKKSLREILAKTRPNESFCSFDPEEIRHGRYLITFEKSKLLSYLSSVTDVGQLDDGSFCPGKWTHYGIYKTM